MIKTPFLGKNPVGHLLTGENYGKAEYFTFVLLPALSSTILMLLFTILLRHSLAQLEVNLEGTQKKLSKNQLLISLYGDILLQKGGRIFFKPFIKRN